MKTRYLILIGIVILSTVPFATIIVLDRYDDYLEQLEYERLAIAGQPKPGERSYIEPVLKAKLEKVELELRDKVKQLHEGLPPSSYAVNLNHQTKEIEAMIENKELIPIVKEFATKYPDDITIIVEYGGISFGLPFEKINTVTDEPKKVQILILKSNNPLTNVICDIMEIECTDETEFSATIDHNNNVITYLGSNETERFTIKATADGIIKYKTTSSDWTVWNTASFD